MAVFDAADRLRPAEEETVVDRHVVGKRIDGLGSQGEHKNVIVLLEKMEIVSVAKTESPVLVVAAREIEKDARARSALRHAEIVELGAAPVETRDSFKGVAVFIVFTAGLGKRNRTPVLIPVTFLHFIKLDKLRG